MARNLKLRKHWQLKKALWGFLVNQQPISRNIAELGQTFGQMHFGAERWF